MHPEYVLHFKMAIGSLMLYENSVQWGINDKGFDSI